MKGRVKDMGNKENGGSFAVGFIVGGAIGALAALLLAPKKGSETRSDLLERSLAMRSRAEELAAQARTQAQDRAAVGVATARERIGPAYEGMRERVTPVVEQVSARMARNNADGADSTAAEEESQQEKA